MPRKRFDAVTSTTEVDMTELSNVVDSYINNKALEKEYKDKASVENTKIKSIMETANISSFTANNGVAKISEQTKETFREDELIEYLKSSGYDKSIVKMKEYIDYDALENAIYHSDIPEDIVKGMDDFKDVKVTKVLRISAKKGDSE